MSNTLNRRAVKALRTPRQETEGAVPHVIIHSTQPSPAAPDGEWERTHARLTAWKAHGHLLEARRLLREGAATACDGSGLAHQFTVADESLAVAMAVLEEVGRPGRTNDHPPSAPLGESLGIDGA